MAHDHPITAAVRVLRSEKVPFVPHLYDYVEKGGTAASAASLGVSEHSIVKTLVMENEHKEPLVVLMHGDREVSTKALARLLGVKTIRPCDPKTADRHSGYQVGGTSPFGLRRAMPIYMERSIAALETMYVNGGKRGFLVAISPEDAIRVLQPTLADIAAADSQ
jgi:Cys-tRNA(Pro) deacylase